MQLFVDLPGFDFLIDSFIVLVCNACDLIFFLFQDFNIVFKGVDLFEIDLDVLVEILDLVAEASVLLFQCGIIKLLIRLLKLHFHLLLILFRNTLHLHLLQPLIILLNRIQFQLHIIILQLHLIQLINLLQLNPYLIFTRLQLKLVHLQFQLQIHYIVLVLGVAFEQILYHFLHLSGLLFGLVGLG